MSLVLPAPEDVINAALARIGYKLRIGSIYEGSMAAKKALDIYGQTRDELLRQDDWGFAERNVTMTLLKSAPSLPGGGYGYIPPVTWNATSYPPLPYYFQYAYPSDCLKVRAIKSPNTLIVLPNMDPRPRLWKVFNDNTYNPAQKCIASYVANGELVYTGQVTDPTTWESDFVELMIDRLAQLLAPSINPD